MDLSRRNFLQMGAAGALAAGAMGLAGPCWINGGLWRGQKWRKSYGS